MNGSISVLLHIYSKLLLLYPRRFQNEFAKEMQVVFKSSVSDAVKDGVLSLLMVCLREALGLPFNILREFWYEFQGKETSMVTNEDMEPKAISSGRTSHWEALIGALPFALFGLVSMISKVGAPFVGVYTYLAMYVFVLLGLMIGLIRGVPRWAYCYLGWSLVYAWWWMNMSTSGLNIFGYIHPDEAWGWRSWYPLFVAIGLALLWARSLRPIRQLVTGIWHDWTLLSLAMQAFVGFMMLLYDENHSPYLIAFMIASTLVISASVWIFMRNNNPLHRFLSLLSGFAASLIIDRICESTWDFAAYYRLPAQPPMPWYDSISELIAIIGFWGLILLLPALVGFVRSIVNKDIMT